LGWKVKKGRWANPLSRTIPLTHAEREREKEREKEIDARYAQWRKEEDEERQREAARRAKLLQKPAEPLNDDYPLSRGVKTSYFTPSYYEGSGYWGAEWDDYEDRDYGEFFGKKVKGKSSSSYVWGAYTTYYSWEKKNRVDLGAILSAVGRSANVLSNAAPGQDERELKVAWSDGRKVNEAPSDIVYLSSEVVTPGQTRKEDWSQDERTDVLIGEALCESTLKRTMDPRVEKEMLLHQGNELIELMVHRIWYASERIEAETEVVRDYPGFKGYFASHRDYYTDQNAQQAVQAYADAGENAVYAAQALIWEMLHPNERLKLRDRTAALVKEGFDKFAEAEGSEARATVARELVKRLVKEWPLPEEQAMYHALVAAFIGFFIGLPANRGEAVKGEDDDDKSEDKDAGEGPVPTGLVEVIDKAEAYGPAKHQKVRVTFAALKLYQMLLMRLNGRINELRYRLKFRNEINKLVEHGLRRGELDEGSLYKLGFFPYGYDDPHLFQKEEIKSPPDTAVCLLIDESGSMDTLSVVDGRRRFAHARDCAIVIANALLSIRGMKVCVLGHTAEGHGHDFVINDDSLVMHHYFTPERCAPVHLASMARIGAFCNNVDGYAVASAATLMQKWYPECEKKLIVHVNDGQPHGKVYGGMSAKAHLRQVIDVCYKEGVTVVGIGIDNAFNEDTGRELYGDGRCAVISSSMQTLVISHLITKFALRY
jgi:hypothetical protein